MNYLAFDTTMKLLTVTAEIDCKALTYADSKPLTASVALLPAIDSLTKGDLNNIDVFACNIGPGSFTGIRIGVTTLKSLAYALNKKIVSFNTFELLAYNIIDSNFEKCFLAVDGGNRTCYVAVFDRKTSKISDEQNLTFSETAALFQKMRYPYVSFDGIPDLEIENKLLKTGTLSEAIQKVTERKINKRDFSDYLTLEPLYLQLSQAEKERL